MSNITTLSSSTPALLLSKDGFLHSPSLSAAGDSSAVGLSESSSTVTTVVVHPMVLLSVLDHHTRRQEGQPRVIGTLLGKRDGSQVEVTNCFAVPHAERGSEVAIGKDFNRQMLALHLRANRKETVVGWYATSFPEPNPHNGSEEEYTYTYGGQCIADTSTLIHEFYAEDCAEASGLDACPPIHLVVDTSLVSDSIGIRAYTSSAISLMGEPLANMFHEVRLLLKSSESETIVLNEMIRSLGNVEGNGEAEEEAEEKKGAVVLGSDPSNDLQASMEKLLEMLETASEYAGAVVDGKLQADDVVGRQIFDTLSNIPRIRPEMFEKMFSDSLQDLLMVTYLSNITRTQLAIAEKLNATLDQNLK